MYVKNPSPGTNTYTWLRNGTTFTPSAPTAVTDGGLALRTLSLIGDYQIRVTNSGGVVETSDVYTFNTSAIPNVTNATAPQIGTVCDGSGTLRLQVNNPQSCVKYIWTEETENVSLSFSSLAKYWGVGSGEELVNFRSNDGPYSGVLSDNASIYYRGISPTKYNGLQYRFDGKSNVIRYDYYIPPTDLVPIFLNAPDVSALFGIPYSRMERRYFEFCDPNAPNYDVLNCQLALSGDWSDNVILRAIVGIGEGTSFVPQKPGKYKVVVWNPDNGNIEGAAVYSNIVTYV